MCDLGVFADIKSQQYVILVFNDHFCRYQKCLRQGMLKEGVRLDRVHRTFQDHLYQDHLYQDHQSKTLPS